MYLMSCTRLFLLGLPPPFLHTTSDQKLEAGMAWERGYTEAEKWRKTGMAWEQKVGGQGHVYVAVG